MLDLCSRSIAEGVLRVNVAGTLLLGEDTACFRSGMQRLRGKYREVQLDLSRLRRMDAAGIGALVEAYAQFEADGATLRLYDMSHRVHELLCLVKLLTVFGPCVAYESKTAA